MDSARYYGSGRLAARDAARPTPDERAYACRDELGDVLCLLSMVQPLRHGPLYDPAERATEAVVPE